MEYPEYDVMCQFPLLSASEDLKKWTGFISTVQGKTKILSVAVPQFPFSGDIQLVRDDLDENTVRYWTPLLEQISLDECDTLLKYLEALKIQGTAVFCGVHCTPRTPRFRRAWVHQGSNNSESQTDEQVAVLENSELYPTVIEEIEEIGIKNVVSLSEDFREIIIKHQDLSRREHLLKLSIPNNYPQAKPTVFAEIPYPKESFQWPGRIKEINRMFLTYLEQSRQFWDDMEELDSSVRVLDPMQPDKSHYHRKILLEDNVIMHLVFNAAVPRAFPLISFAGPEKHLEAYNAAVDRECNVWDPSLKVLQNLKSILNCVFVQKEDDDENPDDQAPCTVCYVYNFEDEIPEITCECGASYHNQCLYDLFVSDVAKTALRRCVECPSCQMEIRVPPGFVTNATTW